MAKWNSLYLIPILGKVREALRSPNEVLNSLRTHTTIANYQFERLYRNLYNPNFYLIAYQNIYSNKGSMTKGIDGKTLDGMGMERINHIIPDPKRLQLSRNQTLQRLLRQMIFMKKFGHYLLASCCMLVALLDVNFKIVPFIPLGTLQTAILEVYAYY